MVEQVGSGIGRIKELMKQARLLEPVFKTEGMFTVVLHRTVEKTPVEIILSKMEENPKVTIKELSELTGLSRRGVEYNIDKLETEKIIERIGGAKGGSWKVLK